ncbi:dihydrofolate reductase family protein [Glycomyces harbinensis]|uniref:RibD C-terminal domain-containing protein n=1 Tax=Glycomyces harbinensis TaxID=58114 RepID=A0A1G6RIV6_9ACTN|nr:dihydrofolate reductase family protein [Glycomyces harbinensis]SDD04304.1 RibD C-terminal domain-containing protein [Glycomyces harbinensis]
MGVLRYSINTTLDGCCDHEAVNADESLHRHSTETIGRADALLFGRVVYGMMEGAWRLPESGEPPEWMEPWMVPFARAIDAKPKYVVSSTLESADWNAQLVEGDLAEAVRALKSEYDSLYTGGVTLPLALAELDLIDEYEFVIHPRLAGRGPAPFAGLTAHIDLVPTTRFDLACGAVVARYEPKR